MSLSPTSPLPPAPLLADYQLLRLIGRGSYGDVWLARGVTGVFRAVKVVWRERFPDLRPYEREFEGITRFAAISLREPSQLALLHAGRSDAAGFFYYVMELADDVARGREIDPATYRPCTLQDWFAAAADRRELTEVVEVGAALCRAVASLHAAGLVHRDIKPSNVILVGGVPKLADVGLVAMASAGLTFVGTEGFVPPEGPGAPAADVFSLGKVLYELATGLDRHEFPRLPPDFGRRPDRPALLELNEVIVRACEPDPARRFPDAAALLDELLLLQAGKSVRRLRRAEKRTARALRIAAALALIAALAGAGAGIERRRADAETRLRRDAEAARDEERRRHVYAARLAQAHRAIEQEDFGRARRLLAEAQPGTAERDQRGLEWHALARLAQGDPCDVLRERGPAIDFIAPSPDGTLVAVHDEAGFVALYDAATLELTRTVPGVLRLAGFSSDGTWLVGTDARGAVQRWRTADGTAPGPGRALGSVRPLGPQGADRLVVLLNPRVADATRPVAARPLTISVWDFAAQREVYRAVLGEATDAVPWEFFRGALDREGGEAVLACVRGRGTALQFRLSHVRLHEATSVTHEPVTGFLPSAVGLLELPGPRRRAWAADSTTGHQLIRRDEGDGWTLADASLPTAISAQLQGRSAKGDFLLLVHGARITARWLDAAGKTEGTAGGHGTLISAAAIAGRDSIFTGTSTGELRRWQPDALLAPKRTYQAWNSQAAASQVLFSEDGRWLYAPENGRDLAVLDVATLAVRGRVAGVRRVIGRAGPTLFGLSADGHGLVRWPEGLNPGVEELVLATSPVANAAVSQDGRRLCFTQATGELCTWDEASSASLATATGRHEYLWSLHLDRSGQRLWSVGHQRRLECRLLPAGTLAWSVPLPAVASSLAPLPGERILAVALENGEVQLHDANTGRLQRAVTSGSAALQSIRATADGQRLIAAGIEGELHVLDGATGEYVAAIPVRGTGPPHHLALTTTGERIGVLGKTGLLRVIEAR